MNKIILGIFVFSLFLLAACENLDLSKISDKDLERVSEKLIVCEKPYMRFESGCCLDKNENKICDRDERELTADEKTKESNYQSEEPKIESDTNPQDVTERLDEREEIIVNEASVQQSCYLSDGSGLRCEKAEVSSDSTSLWIKNSLAEDISIKSAEISDGANSCNLRNSLAIISGNVAEVKFNGRCIKGDIKLTFIDPDGFSKTTTGNFGDERTILEKCMINSGSGLFCDKFSITVADSITLKVKNSLADAVTVTTVSEISDGTNSCALVANTAIAADASESLVFSADGSVGTCAGLTASGAKIKGDISLTFTDPDGFSKTTTGSLVAKSGGESVVSEKCTIQGGSGIQCTYQRAQPGIAIAINLGLKNTLPTPIQIRNIYVNFRDGCWFSGGSHIVLNSDSVSYYSLACNTALVPGDVIKSEITLNYVIGLEQNSPIKSTTGQLELSVS